MSKTEQQAKRYVYTEKGAQVHGTKAGDPYTRTVSKAALRQYLKAGYITEVQDEGVVNMKFYKVYLGGSYVSDVIEAPSMDEAYAMIGDDAEEYQLFTPAEYDHWFGGDVVHESLDPLFLEQ